MTKVCTFQNFVVLLQIEKYSLIVKDRQPMKKRYLVLMLLLLLVESMNAQLQHSVYMSLGGGVSWMIDNAGYTTPKAGGGANFGFGYELRHNHLIFDAGIEGNYNRMNSYVNDFVRDYSAVDTEGDAFTWHHSFYERLDNADLINVSIPLLLGGRYEYVYFLLGPKLKINVWGRNKENSMVDATAKYEGLLGEFKDMENHSLYKGRSLSDPWRTYSTGFNLSLVGEVGIPLNSFISNEPGDDALSKAGLELRVGLYYEAGVLSMRRGKTDGDLVNYENVDKWPGVDFTQTYVFRASETKGAYVTDMEVGVRLRLSFGMPEKKNCVICTDNYNL